MLDFKEAVNICIKQKLFVINDRASRSEFWWFALAEFLFAIAGIFVAAIFLGLGLYFISYIVIGVWSLGLIALIIPAFTVSVRRLHDIDFRGWWLLLTFVPFGNLALLVMYVWPGTQGSNRFGADPLSNNLGNNQVSQINQTQSQFNSVEAQQTDFTKIGQ